LRLVHLLRGVRLIIVRLLVSHVIKIELNKLELVVGLDFVGDLIAVLLRQVYVLIHGLVLVCRWSWRVI